MKQVCELRRLTGGRYLVVLEDDSFFPLYGKELEEFGIDEDGLLREEVFLKISQELLPKRAKLCAMHFLQSSDRTEHQLRHKLASLFYPEKIVDETVAYVKKYHYIDDIRFAVNYMECRRDSRSMRQMEQELYQKGISKETFSEAVQQIDVPDEEEQIQKWLVKKNYSGISADRKEKERMYRFLLRKGYGASRIQRALCMEEPYE